MSYRGSYACVEPYCTVFVHSENINNYGELLFFSIFKSVTVSKYWTISDTMSTENKRRLSSDGKTPKPQTETTKMADQDDKCESTESLDPITIIAQAVQRLQKGQSSLQSMIEGKLDEIS